MEQIKSQIRNLNENLTGYTIFDTFHAKTKLPRSFLVYGAILFYTFLVILDMGGLGQILCNTIGFIYPSYLSLKALKTVSKNDDTELLVYWVVYGFFNVIEFWSKSILGWIPFYFFFKTLFLIYIAVPQTKGANFVYNKFIVPVSEKYIFTATEKINTTKITNSLEEQFMNRASKASGFSS
ncbi:hypothetical protein QEN19_003414 [Hanseniaspora menglaensis]